MDCQHHSLYSHLPLSSNPTVYRRKRPPRGEIPAEALNSAAEGVAALAAAGTGRRGFGRAGGVGGRFVVGSWLACGGRRRRRLRRRKKRRRKPVRAARGQLGRRKSFGSWRGRAKSRLRCCCCRLFLRLSSPPPPGKAKTRIRGAS